MRLTCNKIVTFFILKGGKCIFSYEILLESMLELFMRKKQRALIGCIATCACFFAATLSGSFVESIEQEVTDTNLKQVNSLTQEAPTPTNTVVPTATPTVTPLPTNTPTPTPTSTPTPTPTPALTAYTVDFTIPNIKSNLNIRSGPSTDAEIIGKLPAESFAYILDIENDWVEISTGSIKSGYINATYLYSEDEIKNLCDTKKWISAKITTEVLNVRSGPSTDTEIIDKLKKGEKVTVLLSKSFNEWLAIKLDNGTTGYISSDYATISHNLQTGSSLEEIEEKKRQEEQKRLEEERKAKEAAEKAKAAIAKARVSTIAETKRNPISMTEDEIFLFASVIYTEAANQQYEGMLAVANVILNRLESKRWGNTLEEVLYAPEQFAGATKRQLEAAWKRGIPDICYKAANEALAGRNNIGNFEFFRTVKKADLSTFKEFYILEDHVFYRK